MASKGITLTSNDGIKHHYSEERAKLLANRSGMIKRMLEEADDASEDEEELMMPVPSKIVRMAIDWCDKLFLVLDDDEKKREVMLELKQMLSDNQSLLITFMIAVDVLEIRELLYEAGEVMMRSIKGMKSGKELCKFLNIKEYVEDYTVSDEEKMVEEHNFLRDISTSKKT